MDEGRAWSIASMAIIGSWGALALSVRFLVPGPPDVPPDAFELPSPWLLLAFVMLGVAAAAFMLLGACRLCVVAFYLVCGRRPTHRD